MFAINTKFFCYFRDLEKSDDVNKKDVFLPYAAEKMSILENEYSKKNRRKTLYGFLNGINFNEEDEKIYKKYRNSLEQYFHHNQIIESQNKLKEIRDKSDNQTTKFIVNLMILKLDIFIKQLEEVSCFFTFLHLFLKDIEKNTDLSHDNKIKVMNSFLFFMFQNSKFYFLDFLNLIEKNQEKIDSIKRDLDSLILQSIVIQAEENIGLPESSSLYQYIIDGKDRSTELKDCILESILVISSIDQIKSWSKVIDKLYRNLDSMEDDRVIWDLYIRHFALSSLSSCDEIYYAIGFLATNRDFFKKVDGINSEKGFFEFFMNKNNTTIYMNDNTKLLIRSIVEFRIQAHIMRYFNAYKRQKKFDFEKVNQILKDFKNT